MFADHRRSHRKCWKVGARPDVGAPLFRLKISDHSSSREKNAVGMLGGTGDTNYPNVVGLSYDTSSSKKLWSCGCERGCELREKNKN